MNHSHTIVKEVIWLTAILLSTIIVLMVFIGYPNFLSGVVDIQLYDTYYVIAPIYMIFFMFNNLVFLAYLFRQKKDKFNLKLPNYILIFSSILLIVQWTKLLYLAVGRGPRGGWVIYPPNSVLPPPEQSSILFKNPNLSIFLVQFLLMSFLVFVAVKTSKIRTTH